MQSWLSCDHTGRVAADTYPPAQVFLHRHLFDGRIGITAFLWIGTLLGASFGLLHGAWVARQQFAASGDLTRALWFALWTLVLWTVFGAYLLAFLLVGAAAYALSRPFRREEAAR